VREIESTGEAFLRQRLELLQRHAQKRRPTCVVFDLDNTLFDTRYRTLAVARRFDALRPPPPLASLTHVAQIRERPQETLARLGGIAQEVADAFAEFWLAEFWNPERFVHDVPIDETLRWAVAARDAGADIRFLTGRIERLRGPSMKQLHEAGLHVPDDALACKPDLSHRTADFKAGVLERWSQESFVGWFLTEGRRDVAHMQRALPQVPCVLLDCSFDDDRPAEIAEDTPTLPRVF